MKDTSISPAAEAIGRPVSGPANSPRRILVVDDDRDSRQLTIEVLTSSGFEVRAAKDGADGYEAVQARNYDLIITDNKMPRMTGLEMIAKLRAGSMSPPVIMATGQMPTEEFARKPWLKPDVELQKPYSYEDLLTAVRDVLRRDDGGDCQRETLLPKYL